MCDSYVTESFITAIPQSSSRDIQPCIVSSVYFSLVVLRSEKPEQHMRKASHCGSKQQ